MDGCQQVARLRVLGIGQYLRRRSAFDDSSVVHDCKKIGDLAYQTEIVGDQQTCEGMSRFEIKEKIQDLGLGRQIQTGKRFIEDQ